MAWRGLINLMWCRMSAINSITISTFAIDIFLAVRWISAEWETLSHHCMLSHCTTKDTLQFWSWLAWGVCWPAVWELNIWKNKRCCWWWTCWWRFGRSFSFPNGWFVGSMLIFQGVPVDRYGFIHPGSCRISTVDTTTLLPRHLSFDGAIGTQWLIEHTGIWNFIHKVSSVGLKRCHPLMALICNSCFHRVQRNVQL